MSRISFLSACLFFSLCHAAQAHYVWLEREGAAPAKAYFGEWEKDLREPRKVYAKYVGAAQAVSGDGSRLEIHERENFREIAATSGDTRLSGGFVSEKGVATLYQAKAGRTETAHRLDLELVPLRPGSNSFVLLLRGEPLPETWITLIAPSKWQKSFRTDKDGRVTFATPWPGRYVTEAVHGEKKNGQWDGKPYTQLRHVATTSFIAEP